MKTGGLCCQLLETKTARASSLTHHSPATFDITPIVSKVSETVNGPKMQCSYRIQSVHAELRLISNLRGDSYNRMNGTASMKVEADLLECVVQTRTWETWPGWSAAASLSSFGWGSNPSAGSFYSERLSKVKINWAATRQNESWTPQRWRVHSEDSGWTSAFKQRPPWICFSLTTFLFFIKQTG